jgi:hypothetical protein
VVRHDLRNSLSPIRVLLLRKESRLNVTEAECARYLSNLNVLNLSLDGLSGLEDSPHEPQHEQREEFGEMFDRLRHAFSGNPKAKFTPESKGELKTRIPRLYYAVFAELIRNAVKHRPDDWPESDPSIMITAQQKGTELVITLRNAASAEDIRRARIVIHNAKRALFDEARLNLGDKLFSKGIGLVVSMVRHAQGVVNCSSKTDTLSRRWLNVSIRIS